MPIAVRRCDDPGPFFPRDRPRESRCYAFIRRLHSCRVNRCHIGNLSSAVIIAEFHRYSYHDRRQPIRYRKLLAAVVHGFYVNAVIHITAEWTLLLS